MTLKEELEILRGEPIRVFAGDPIEIPCIETSDAESLCKHPVVSVHMITYNHEPYIRQAIEGVMMQKTDFEFELVIGEDASTDRTREICFEYQKKYPDKIRVLWWHENLRKVKHPAGGNSRRVMAHCRGEFIALCEGDDYWIDPLKLQKQVNAMRNQSNIGYCVTGARILSELPHDHPRLLDFHVKQWVDGNMFTFNMSPYKAGFVPRNEFWKNRCKYPRTCTVMFRYAHYLQLRNRFDIVNWMLHIGDALLWNALPIVSDAFFLPEPTAVYRINSGGMSTSQNIAVFHLDNDLIELYCAMAISADIVEIDRIVRRMLERRQTFPKGTFSKGESLRELMSTPLVRGALKRANAIWTFFFICSHVGIAPKPSQLKQILRPLIRCKKHSRQKAHY